MIYCPILQDYVDQEEDCLHCEHYIELEDTCNHPEKEDKE
jgi:hypothetical protein